MTGVMTGLTAEPSNLLDPADIFMIVDVSDQTMAPTGTNKQIRADAVFASSPFVAQVQALFNFFQGPTLTPNANNAITSETGIVRDAADTGSGNCIFTVKRLASNPAVAPWSNTTAYQLGDMATFSGGYFVCSTANTGTSPVAGATTNSWKYLGSTSGVSPFSWPVVKGTGLLVETSSLGVSTVASPSFANIVAAQVLDRVDPGSLPAPWNSATAYTTNALVQNGGYIYKALQNSTNVVPPANGGSNATWQGNGQMPVQLVAGALTILNFDPHVAAYPVALQSYAYQMVDTDPAATTLLGGRVVFGGDLKARVASSVTRGKWQVNGFETGGEDSSQQHSVNGGLGVHVVNQGPNDLANGLWIGNTDFAGNFRTGIIMPTSARTAANMPQYRGSWVSGTTYQVHDIVQDNSAGGGGAYYICAPWGTQAGAYAASMVSTTAPHSVGDHTWVSWNPASGPRDYAFWLGPVGTTTVDGVSIPFTMASGTPLFYIDSAGSVLCQKFAANGATPQAKQAAAADVNGVNTILRNLGFVT